MAAKKKRKHRARRGKKRAHKRTHHRAKARSGGKFFGRSVSSSGGSFSLDTIPKILLSAAILRVLSGLVYFWFRSQFQKPGADPKKVADDFKKAKIVFPILVAIASAKKWIPQLPGLTPMAISMAFFSIVENTDSLRDLFDLKQLDKQPGGATAQNTEYMQPAAGFGARSWNQTRDQVSRMHERSGIYSAPQVQRPFNGIYTQNMNQRPFSGISVRRAPLGFNGRDPRINKRLQMN